MSIRISFTDILSEQLAQVSGQDSSFISPKDYEGRVRISFFRKTNAPTVGAAQTVALSQLPNGARIIGGRAIFEAHGLDADATFKIASRDGNDIQDVTGLVDISDAGSVDLADTIALGNGFITKNHVFLVVESGEAWPTEDAVLQGYVLYVVD